MYLYLHLLPILLSDVRWRARLHTYMLCVWMCACVDKYLCMYILAATSKPTDVSIVCYYTYKHIPQASWRAAYKLMDELHVGGCACINTCTYVYVHTTGFKGICFSDDGWMLAMHESIHKRMHMHTYYRLLVTLRQNWWMNWLLYINRYINAYTHTHTYVCIHTTGFWWCCVKIDEWTDCVWRRSWWAYRPGTGVHVLVCGCIYTFSEMNLLIFTYLCTYVHTLSQTMFWN